MSERDPSDMQRSVIRNEARRVGLGLGFVGKLLSGTTVDKLRRQDRVTVRRNATWHQEWEQQWRQQQQQ